MSRGTNVGGGANVGGGGRLYSSSVMLQLHLVTIAAILIMGMSSLQSSNLHIF